MLYTCIGVDDEDPEMAGIEEHSEDLENEDDQETSDSDDQETHDSDAEQDLGTSSQSAVEPSMCLRCIYMKYLVHLDFAFILYINIITVFRVKLDANHH